MPGEKAAVDPMPLWRYVRPLRRFAFLRSTFYLAIVFKRWAFDGRWLKPETFEVGYTAGPDCWGYESGPGHERLVRAAALLDGVLNGGRPRRALEIGCAEGAFTQMLAQRCDTVVAVDFAPSALARAAARRDWNGQVRFQRLDLMREPLAGSFDLIALMDVLDYFPSGRMKAACEKVLACLPSGGFLLLTAVKQADIFDTAWWSKWIIRGGRRIKRHFKEHPLLTMVAEAELDTHVLAIFQKI